MTYQYRAVLTCRTDPCVYCREPAQRIVPGSAPWKSSEIAFPTPGEAYDYGLGMATKVYGSEHAVLVERQEMAPWTEIDNLAEVQAGVRAERDAAFREKWLTNVQAG